MKKILFAALAVFALASCAKDVETSAQQYAIDFNPTTKVPHRSTIYTTNNLTSFNVWAYTAAGETVMRNMNVTKTGSDWTYSPKKFWPKDTTVDFYAIVAPEFHEEEADWGLIITADKAEFFYSTNQVDVDGRAYDVPDIMYAVALDKTKAGGKVNMSFHHVMAGVEFKIENKTSEEDLIDLLIDADADVYISNLGYEGTYTLPRTAGATGSWDVDQDEDRLLAHHFDAEGNTISAGSSFMLQPQGVHHLVLPQTTRDAVLYLPCTIKQNNVVIFDGVKQIPLQVEWEEGHTYYYTLQLHITDGDLDTIEFSADVNAFEGVDAGTNNMPF